MVTVGICQLCLSKCSAVTSAQPPRARSCSSGQARRGKREFVRLCASTLEDCSSRIRGIREWEWRCGASRVVWGAAGGKEA